LPLQWAASKKSSEPVAPIEIASHLPLESIVSKALATPRHAPQETPKAATTAPQAQKRKESAAKDNKHATDKANGHPVSANKHPNKKSVTKQITIATGKQTNHPAAQTKIGASVLYQEPNANATVAKKAPTHKVSAMQASNTANEINSGAIVSTNKPQPPSFVMDLTTIVMEPLTMA
jgi:hypothetical protein